MDYTVAMMPSATRTRVLVSQGPDELLRAVLPPPAAVHHERAAIRPIARRLQLARKTVRRLLGRAQERKPPASEPRTSLLDTYDAEIRRLLAKTPELRGPAILERLRPLGYTGGITILRDRLRRL